MEGRPAAASASVTDGGVGVAIARRDEGLLGLRRRLRLDPLDGPLARELPGAGETARYGTRKGLSGSCSCRISSTGSPRPGPLYSRFGKLRTSPGFGLKFL